MESIIMFDLLIILILFPIILIASYIIENILLRNNLGPFSKVIIILRFIGVAVHELCHFFMSLLVGKRPKEIQIKFRSEFTNRPNPHGYIRRDTHKETFLQAALTSLAPLIISTWLILWSLFIALSADFHYLIRILAGFFCISLFLGAAPSSQDFRVIGIIFKEDPLYSIYQIILLCFSGFITWIGVIFFEIVFSIDVFFYILIGLIYYVFKYLINSLSYLIYLLFQKRKKQAPQIKYSTFIRNKFKPSKPYKLGIEEAHW
jgi:hypothetical protein